MLRTTLVDVLIPHKDPGKEDYLLPAHTTVEWDENNDTLKCTYRGGNVVNIGVYAPGLLMSAPVMKEWESLPEIVLTPKQLARLARMHTEVPEVHRSHYGVPVGPYSEMPMCNCCGKVRIRSKKHLACYACRTRG